MIDETNLGVIGMSKTDKLDDSIYYEKAPGSGGIISHIFFAIIGTVIVLLTLVYATNFVCNFAGIDFDAVLWLQECLQEAPQPVQDLFGFFIDLINDYLK